MQGFRLLRASGTFDMRSRQAIANDPGSVAEVIDVEFAPNAKSPTDAWVSVVIGRNGVGKSRLLAGIADVFDRLSRGRLAVRRDALEVSRIEYLLDGQHCVIALDRHQRMITSCDGITCSPDELPMPAKVVALTTTPFDKFRVAANSDQRGIEHISRDDERYVYLGLRDRTGRASTTAAIFRALEGLFEASKSSDEKRNRIGDVFEFLGYAPRIEVRYAFGGMGLSRLDRILAGETVESVFLQNPELRTSRSVERLLKNPDTVVQLRHLGQEALARTEGGRSFVLRADFRAYSDDDDFFRRIQQLRRLGIVRMMAVEVQRLADGTTLDLRLASSGELGIVTGFLGLASAISDNSLIFIDEPEISLHPEWQSRYVELLTSTFGRYRGCHFVLATHSPLILSDINPDASNVVSLDPSRRRSENAADYAGKSYDFLMATAFDEPGNNNLYLKEEIIRALRLAADGKTGSSEFVEALRVLRVSLPKLATDSPIAQLIGELQAAAESAR